MPRKRAASEAIQDANADIPSDDERLTITANCDQIRHKINAFINRGEMEVSDFQKTIKVAAQPYTAFMGMHGPDEGRDSETYTRAGRFFKRRELHGIKPKKKRLSDADTEKCDVSDIHLPGETEGKVPIYDTCDVVRKKIEKHLRQKDVTKAQFQRDLKKMLPEDQKKGIHARGLQLFQKKRGSDGGNTMTLFYAAYVFFEKLRIKENKPKTAAREKMEQVWGKKGMDRTSHMWTFCSQNERPYADEYGRVRIARIY